MFPAESNEALDVYLLFKLYQLCCCWCCCCHGYVLILLCEFNAYIQRISEIPSAHLLKGTNYNISNSYNMH